MPRITINLKVQEQKALLSLAKRERRKPRQQAEVIVVRELERTGLVPMVEPNDGAQRKEANRAQPT